MFCTRCGSNNIDTDQFCRSCGAQLMKPGGAQGAPSGSDQQPYPYSTPNPYSTPSAGQQQQQPQGSTPPYSGYQGYPPPQYGYAEQMSSQQSGASGRAIAALVTSIISFVICCWPAGIVGIVLGKMEMNAIQEGRAPRAGESMAKVGFYMGIAATAISLLFTGLYFLGVLASLGSGY